MNVQDAPHRRLGGLGLAWSPPPSRVAGGGKLQAFLFTVTLNSPLQYGFIRYALWIVLFVAWRLWFKCDFLPIFLSVLSGPGVAK